MDFLRRLFGGRAERGGDNALMLYVRCSRCGAPLRVRVDLRNELYPEYGDMETSGFVLRNPAWASFDLAPAAPTAAGKG